MRSRNRFNVSGFLSLAVGAGLVFFAGRALALDVNLLINTNFSENSGQSVPTSWTFFDDPTISSTTKDFWIGGPPTGGFFATPLSGTQYWKEWGAGYFPTANNVAGISQTFGAAAGFTYQASGWFYTSSSDVMGASSSVWVDVSFLNSAGNLLAIYTSAPFTSTVGEDQWFEYDVTNACNLSSPVATGDPYYTNYAVSGSVSQMVAPTGTTSVRYRFNYLQHDEDGGSCYLDDPALMQTSGSLAPVISNVFPENMIFVPQSNGLSFDVASPSGASINTSAVKVILNGANVSSGLTFGGSSSNVSVLYQGLQSNTAYSVSISAADSFGLSVSASNYFETTWIGIPPVIYLWEAEDFDFTNGTFIDYPDLCDADGDINCYYGKAGTLGVDENSGGENVSHLYRENDFMNIQVSGDLNRANLYLADRTDYEINPFVQNEWINYTRDFTNGTYWIIGRLSSDITLQGSLTMSEVNSDSSLTPLGNFTIAPHGLGWTTFENIFLLDTNGNKVNVKLNGKTTLQVESHGNVLPTFFALVQATVDEPILSGMYPTGTHPFEYTNTLSFNISTIGATFPISGIKVNLDGFDVSSALVITGSPSNETVAYPSLLLNATHMAIISVTNSLGHGFLATNNFDTFYQNNYMVQAADFDFYGGGYFPIVTTNYNFPNWYPNLYSGYAATTNIDYQHTTISGEQDPYRPDGIPQEQGHDYLTTNFINFGAIEYDLGDFGAGDWCNYTGNYPQGDFYIYMRAAGLGSNSMYLEKVVGGATTTNQAVVKLGDWNSVGVNNSTYQWIPLTDDGSVAPLAVKLGGVETLRLTTTTGDCYPNYFMLIPAGGVRISAVRQGANASISFPTQSGVVYRVFYKMDLSSSIWNLQTSVLGNGSVESVSIPAGAGARFYKVTAP